MRLEIFNLQKTLNTKTPVKSPLYIWETIRAKESLLTQKLKKSKWLW